MKGVITETPSPSHVHYTDTSWQNSLNHNNAVTPQPLSRTHWYYLAGSDNSDIYFSNLTAQPVQWNKMEKKKRKKENNNNNTKKKKKKK